MAELSILDLIPIPEGADAATAFRNSLDLAQHAERWGYKRFWLAEHHNMPGIASTATAVAIAHIAGGTQHIRVGSGGIMLPNHAPLIVAEQFGTLETLFPGRIDLGLGRAPGTDPQTARALRRGLNDSAERFPQDVVELLDYFRPAVSAKAVQAVPAAGLRVPVWLLGSSLFSAQLAASLGLPFAFASHFAPDHLMEAVSLYRALFRPSEYLQQPYVMVGINIIAAGTDAEARRLFTSIQQQFVRLRRGELGLLPPPLETMDGFWNPVERAGAERALAFSVVGGRQAVEDGIAAAIEQTGADELMITAQIHDHKARLASFEMAAEIYAQTRQAAEQLANQRV